MTLETQYVHLRKPVAVGDQIDGWQVSWVGGWDRGKVFFVAMLVRKIRGGPAYGRSEPQTAAFFSRTGPRSKLFPKLQPRGNRSQSPSSPAY